jgi:hypothetical protein
MAHVELPRALEDYFAFAETTPTRNGRRFVISLPYFSGSGGASKLDRLQWWYHLRPEAERQMGEAAVATVRAQATEKFRKHIERWLQNTRQRLHGEEPIPRIDPLAAAPEAAVTTVTVTVVANPSLPPVAAPPDIETLVPWPADRVANG